MAKIHTHGLTLEQKYVGAQLFIPLSMNSDSVKGAEASPIVYTMVEMAKANNVSVFHYLNYLLYCRPEPGMTDEEYESFAPWSPEAKAFCSSSH
ncbi:MAG: transposase domain-containing protein [Anaerolineaceae bacterium]|nr:transposase domain-containing protein [Anaerolineaceae bacterium]